MVLIPLSVILAAIAVAVSMIHTSGVLAGSGMAKESFSIVKKRAEQPTNASPTKQFLVVVLPDGKVVNPIAADRF